MLLVGNNDNHYHNHWIYYIVSYISTCWRQWDDLSKEVIVWCTANSSGSIVFREWLPMNDRSSPEFSSAATMRLRARCLNSIWLSANKLGEMSGIGLRLLSLQPGQSDVLCAWKAFQILSFYPRKCILFIIVSQTEGHACWQSNSTDHTDRQCQHNIISATSLVHRHNKELVCLYLVSSYWFSYATE